MHSRRLHWAFAIFLLAIPAFAAQGQKTAQVWTEWETFSPENEEFTVQMPKSRTAESTTFAYHKMELSARLYLATSSAGPVLAITSLSGIKSNPAQYTEFARFNSYVDAFKDFFPSKIRSKETLLKLTLVSSRPFHGHTGRTYKMTLGDLSGSLNAFVTRKRFYAIVSLNTKKDEALDEKFLSSFELPERQAEPKNAAVAAEAAPNTEVQGADAKGEQVLDPNSPNVDGTVGSAPASGQQAKEGPNQNPNQKPDPNQKRPISGGMLNGKAIYLPLPEVPAGEATGVVLVQILIDEQGSVVEARALSGPQHLHVPAVNAARLARFSPTLMMGEPVRVSGTLSYSFVRSN